MLPRRVMRRAFLCRGSGYRLRDVAAVAFVNAMVDRGLVYEGDVPVSARCPICTAQVLVTRNPRLGDDVSLQPHLPPIRSDGPFISITPIVDAE